MSTKVATSPPAKTDQSRPPFGSQLAAAIASSLHPISSSISGPWGASAVSMRTMNYVSDKVAEANRQIDRVKSLASVSKGSPHEISVRLDSIASSVNLIGAMVSSPIPIPVASSGSDSGTTLFFDDEDFYGDIEINGKTVEYFIRSKTGEGPTEVFDSEEVENGFIPPRLLYHLFSHYAK